MSYDERIEEAATNPKVKKLHKEYQEQLLDTIQASYRLLKELGVSPTPVNIVGSISTDAYDVLKRIMDKD